MAPQRRKFRSIGRGAAACLAIWLGLYASVLVGAEANGPHRDGKASEKTDAAGTIARLSEAIRRDPKDAAAYNERGRAYYEEGQYEQALADLNESLRLDPKRADAYYNRAAVRLDQDQKDRALADLAEAIRLSPKFTEAYLVRGWIYAEQGELAEAIAAYSAAIQLDPDDASARYDRAICLTDQKKYREAVADLNVALRLDPKDVRSYGARGAAYLYQGDFDRGMEDLKTAIRLNAGDAGANYQPQKRAELSLAQLGHGRRQLRGMLRDRPAMAQHLAPGDLAPGDSPGAKSPGAESPDRAVMLREWAERKFAGEDLGQLIDWDPTAPRDSDAENVAAAGEAHARILIAPTYTAGPKAGAPRSFEELWAGAVFELHNVVYGAHFTRLHQEAAAGKLTKHEFVAGILKYEYQAAQRTRGFYVQVYLPWAKQQRLPTDPSLWFTGWWDHPDEALQGFSDPSAYPWRPYGRQYDWLSVQWLHSQQQHQKALALLRQMQAQKENTQDAVQVHLWIGRCRMDQGETAAAVEALSEAIRLAPNHANAYLLRGEVYQKQGERAKAEADFSKAEQLGARRP